jgi:hypothetical protein
MHQFVWDLRHEPPTGAVASGRGGGRFGAGAGPWALPGQYSVKLTVDGQSYTQSLTLKMDPRVQVSQSDLQKQFDLARKVTALISQTNAAQQEARTLRTRIQAVKEKAGGSPVSDALNAFERKLQELAGSAAPVNPEFFGMAEDAADRSSLRFIGGELAQIAGSINSADAAPTLTVVKAFDQVQKISAETQRKWTQLKDSDLKQLNSVLRENNLSEIAW